MYELTVITDFAAAHSLREYEGECENLHGHNWKVEAAVITDRLDDTGLAVDFKLLKKWLNDILEGLDHRYLNELELFKTKNPSSENIARFIFKKLEKSLKAYDEAKGRGVYIKKVTVWESERAWASYYED
ncbi:MAG: 6-carboxytetrahydropterin synthase QueD [Thermodesulfobacteriota bacterium]